MITLMMCMVVNITRAEEQYWETIKKLKTDYAKAKGIQANDEAGGKLVEYVRSLTAKQLMEAGRQCSEDLDASFHKHGFAEGAGFVISFFIAQYPETAGLGDIRPIFKEIEDSNRTDMWRSTLVYSFKTSLWQKKLSDNQLRDVTNNIDKILTSKNVYYRVTNESFYTTRVMLQEIENRNAKNISSTNDVNDVNNSNQEKMAKEITQYYTRFSRRLMNISGEPNLNPELQMVSFALLRDILDKPIESKAEVENVLASAIRNYEKHDEKTWRLLAQIGIEKLQMSDGEQIAQRMADKLEQRIKSETDNNIKYPLQSDLKSIKQLTKRQIDQ
jgi:bacterioferritin (cytochrome b1)